MRFSFFFSSFLFAGTVALAGCGASADADAQPSGDVDAVESDVKSASFVGDWFTHRGVDGIFARLHLENGSKYEGDLLSGGKWTHEKGTWSVTTVSGQKRLHLVPSTGAAHEYDVSKKGKVLTLTTIALTPTFPVLTIDLTELAKGSCLDDGDCGSGEYCPPRMCLMYCAAGDPSCCGPSTCTPKPTGPKCGRTQCEAGQVCCNSLSGICTAPGEMCAF